VRINRLFVLGMVFAMASAGAAWSIGGSVVGRNDPWNSKAITATYIGAQLRQMSGSDAALFLAYELKNNTNTDYRLSDGPGYIIMSRIKPDGSLNSQEQIRVSYPTFLPARQAARIALQIERPFNWPADGDPLLQDKLTEFVTQKLSDVDGLVLFDQPDRCQINFPSGWQSLALASETNR
jgi:hypothetical protein